jgi:hypothetical protein
MKASCCYCLIVGIKDPVSKALRCQYGRCQEKYSMFTCQKCKNLAPMMKKWQKWQTFTDAKRKFFSNVNETGN